VRLLVVLVALLGATLAPAANAKADDRPLPDPSKNIGYI
jgi:hypothetical protein